MKIQNPTKSQLKQVDALSSHVFLQDRQNESMAERYPALLGAENLKHINVVFEENVIMTDVNWYPATIKIEDSLITVGSIGGVCSNEKARGKGYADALVKHSLTQMRDEGVSICLISGVRSLYSRNGAFTVGKEYEFEFDEKKKSDRVQYADNTEIGNLASIVWSIHSKNDNRFVRNMEHTEKVLRAVGKIHHRNIGELYYTDNAYVIAYVNLDNMDEDIKICEFSGDRDGIIEIFKHICDKTGKKVCGTLSADDTDLKDLHMKEIPLIGMLKIINAPLLFKQLKYRFERFSVGEISVNETENGFCIKMGGNDFEINTEDMHKLVFGSTSDLFEKAPEGFDKVFPIPMPCITGLDYI